MSILRPLFKFFASYALSIILLLLLLVLVFFGTLEQMRMGLFEVQRRYFESFGLVHYLFGRVPLPLPGGYLLLTLVFVNMVCGAILRAPKRLARPGLLIAHGGVIFLIAAGFITHHYSVSGNLPLYEGQRGDRFQSYFDWEIRITEVGEGGSGRQLVIPQTHFEHLEGGGSQAFFADALPFDLRVTRYYPNCRPVPGSGPWAVENITFESLPRQGTAEHNIPGVVIMLYPPAGMDAPAQPGLLWGMEKAPWRIAAGDREYALALGRREWVLPFSLTLNVFNHERHAGTSIASHFSSALTLTEGNASRDVVIMMNEPLRHRGYTFYQASWGPTDARPGDPLYSVLAVTRNPAGEWPLYASCVISFGLLLHFSRVLFRYLKRSTKEVSS